MIKPKIEFHDVVLCLILGFLVSYGFYTVRELRRFNDQVQEIKKALGGGLFGG